MNLVWIISLQILGVGLLCAEVFLPSFGLLAIAMITAVGGSLWLAFDQRNLFLLLLGLDVILFPWLGWYLMRFVGAGPMGLPHKLESGAGLSLIDYTGQSGTAITDLRPSGKARIAEEIVDVVSDGTFLTKGCALVVVDSHHGRVVVRAAPPVAPH
jgi:membrane-bound serine protease (ClpP class)